MRVLVELQYPNMVMDVRGFFYRAQSMEDGACTPSISPILQMRGQIGTMRIVPCVKVVPFFSPPD